MGRNIQNIFRIMEIKQNIRKLVNSLMVITLLSCGSTNENVKSEEEVRSLIKESISYATSNREEYSRSSRTLNMEELYDLLDKSGAYFYARPSFSWEKDSTGEKHYVVAFELYSEPMTSGVIKGALTKIQLEDIIQSYQNPRDNTDF